jgi:hypothetical protein
MAGRMSNRDRIAQRAEEAEAARKEKETKAAKKEATPRKKATPKVAAPPGRTKIVWAVCDHSGAQVKTFPYREEAAARAEAEKLTAESGKAHWVARAEVPFE